MKALIQRVTRAKVSVEGHVTGKIQTGLCVFLGIGKSDTTQQADYIVRKILSLRIFENEQNRMDKNVLQHQGSILLIPQFTLYAECRKGNRPDFTSAAPPEKAQPLYEYTIGKFRDSGTSTATGVFGAHMLIDLINDGPVTIMLQSP